MLLYCDRNLFDILLLLLLLLYKKSLVIINKDKKKYNIDMFYLCIIYY